jgi:hypothetical protein
MKRVITQNVLVLSGLAIIGGIIFACGKKSSSSSSSTTSTTRSLTAFQTDGASIPTSAPATTGTCTQLTRATTSCQSSREALGLSGNWLSFSCNVVIGLATSSGASTTSYADATYITLTTPDLPDYKTNYYTTTGSYSFTAYDYTVEGTFDSLYTSYTTAYPDPNTIASQSAVLSIPITPSAAASETQTMSGGVVGMTINGVLIYDNVAANTDNIFEEAGSFDPCQGHASSEEGGRYHYHGEPYAISYDDNLLIGVMRDGYFIYGRKDYDGTVPSNSSGDMYTYGGHAGYNSPVDGTSYAGTFHYHANLWEGCYDRDGSGNSYADDGLGSACVSDTGANTGSGSGTSISAYFLTGKGNGGVFDTIPTSFASSTTAITNNVTAIRYYYGTPASTCTGC